MHTFHSEEFSDEMRGTVACPVPVCNLWQHHVRIVDMLRLDEEAVFAGERSLASRFGFFLSFGNNTDPLVCRERLDCIP